MKKFQIPSTIRQLADQTKSKNQIRNNHLLTTLLPLYDHLLAAFI
jgi:hypothetical protein